MAQQEAQVHMVRLCIWAQFVGWLLRVGQLKPCILVPCCATSMLGCPSGMDAQKGDEH